MKVHWKKEIYSIGIENWDPIFTEYNMDNRQYARINGKWHYHTGGSELEWRAMDRKKETDLLEVEFQKLMRADKLDQLV